MPHFQENEGWGPPGTPSVVLRWDHLKHYFLKNSLKSLLRHFLYMFVFTHPQAPFRQLSPSFLGWKSKWIWQIIHNSLYLFYDEGSSKTSCWHSLQRNLINLLFFFSNPLIVYNTWYTETKTYKKLITLTRIKRLVYNNFLLRTVHMKVSKHCENSSFLFYIILYNCFSF